MAALPINNKTRRRRLRLLLAGLFAAMVVIFLISMTQGIYPLSLHEIFQIIGSLLGFSTDYTHNGWVAFMNVRLPRLTACIFVGAALSASGAAYQGIFHNPMVSPDLLGASSGAAFGACVSILLSASILVQQLSAFACGIAAVVLTLAISSVVSRRENNTTTLVLTGMVVSSLFSAGVSITKLLADTDSQLGEITFWLMGSMAGMKLNALPILMIPVTVSLIPLLLLSYRLNLLSFGDEEAQTLGVNVKAVRLVMICCATLATSASVAGCGMVGWIGLVIPHLMRFLVGPDYKYLLPASTMGGAIFLILVDNITRIFFTVEVSIGILTALIGAPFFLILLVKGRESWL
ncbi:MAG: iron ABC transporter permease [Oscillospiraceae bacterium]|nr:iron ABC transporter permease [Oscillospiraceae bacterium]